MLLNNSSQWSSSLQQEWLIAVLLYQNDFPLSTVLKNSFIEPNNKMKKQLHEKHLQWHLFFCCSFVTPRYG